MSPSATLATQNESSCEQVPRLPRKVPRRDGRLTAPKRATRASPVPQVPRLPRQTRVDVAKCYACHAKRRWMSPSATPATQSAKVPRHHGRPTAAPPEKAQCHKCHACHAKQKVDVAKCHACHKVPRRH